MKTTKFVVEAKKHQAQNNKSGKAGCYRGRGNYAHILPIDSNTKEAKWDAIKKYGLLEAVKQYAKNDTSFYNHFFVIFKINKYEKDYGTQDHKKIS